MYTYSARIDAEAQQQKRDDSALLSYTPLSSHKHICMPVFGAAEAGFSFVLNQDSTRYDRVGISASR